MIAPVDGDAAIHRRPGARHLELAERFGGFTAMDRMTMHVEAGTGARAAREKVPARARW